MVEISNHNLDANVELQGDLAQLKEGIINNNLNEWEENSSQDGTDKEKIKSIEKLGKNKVRFPYESNEHECSLILEKKGNNIFVKLEKIPTYMGNAMNNEFKKAEKKQRLIGKMIDASSSEVFLKGLGKALDDMIGTGRVSASEKAKEAYKLLGFK